MEKNSEILSNITIYNKYAKYNSILKRRESWEELVRRNMNMHIKRFPQLKEEIIRVYETHVLTKKVLPSMRSLQFAGKPIELNPVRIYNCCALPIDDYRAFNEVMFLLLSGTGVGYSVQQSHIDKLPEVVGPNNKSRRFVIGDSIEGWSDAVKILMKSYFFGKSKVQFDFSDIREKGTELITSGGKAPGPAPLEECLVKIKYILEDAIGRQLKDIEVHDILCHIADAVLAGGIRRAAMISLFNADSSDMLSCKSGNWWELNPQRGRANNSAVLLRHKLTEESFRDILKKTELSNAGEPGIYLTNDKDWLTNPCQPAWATVLTPNGLSTIGEIKEGDSIWSETGWTKVLKKWSTGIKQVKEYRTTSGVFYGTENHKLLSNGVKIEAKDCKTIDSLRGTYPKSTYSNYEQDIVDGLVIGDGTMHKASNNKIVLNIGKDDQDYFISNIDPYIKDKSSIGKYAYDVDTTIDYLEHTYNRSIPKRYFEDKNKLSAFLKGLYSANGSVVNRRVVLKTASSKMRDDVQLALSCLGIKSYYTTNKSKKVLFDNGEYECKESYDVNISTDIDKFFNTIGFLQLYKNGKLLNILNSKKKKADKLTYPIKYVKDVSIEEVFDITVDNDTHTYWTGGLNVSNCCEIALRPFQFCNLVEINASDIENQQDLNERCNSAAFIATLQASYTNFHYLRPIWQRTTEKDALLGVSMTGIASGTLKNLDLEEGVKHIKDINSLISESIGINEAARTTCVKPAGTTSLVLGTSSGIHAWHNDYYIRRIRLLKEDALYKYLAKNHPNLIEDEIYRPQDTAVLQVPIKAPDGAALRTESPIDLLERIKYINEHWIKPGHLDGNNTHNVSATISIEKDQWELVVDWMWNNRDVYNGISLLPYDGGTYQQAPFEDITKEQYEEMSKLIDNINLLSVIEDVDNTDLSGEIACGAAGCEII